MINHVLEDETIDNICKEIYDKKYNLVIVEGYEMTGKSTLIRKLSVEFNKMLGKGYVSSYRPNYGLFDKCVSKGDRFLLGLTVVDFLLDQKLQKVNDTSKLILMDRGLPSSIVYKNIYNQMSGLSDIIVNQYVNILKMLNTCIIYLNHSDIDHAKLLYEKSNSDLNHKDDYDRFLTFEDYYEMYEKFDYEYKEVFNKITKSIPTYIISSYKD